MINGHGHDLLKTENELVGTQNMAINYKNSKVFFTFIRNFFQNRLVMYKLL